MQRRLDCGTPGRRLQGFARDVALLLLDLRDHRAEADDIAAGLIEPRGLHKQHASQHRNDRQVHACKHLDDENRKEVVLAVV